MQRQWYAVLGIVAALALGTVAMLRRGPAQIEVGAVAPDFHAIDLATNDSVSLYEKYRGQVTLVNIWATWCEPCKREIPALDSLYRALAPEGLHIAAVSIDKTPAAEVKAFMAEFNVAFDVLQDPEGTIQQIYQTTGVPESFLIGRDGRIIRIVYADHPWASASNKTIVRQLLAVPGVTGSP
jgi:cytochrome c biogenesis protein CcmG, thiol:disulfide interchange protein DsbE